MERMKSITETMWRWRGAVGEAQKLRYGGVRLVGRGSNRSSVHGAKLPSTTILENEEEVRESIKRGKEEKEKKRSEVEKKVDSRVGNSGNLGGHGSSSGD